MESVHRVAPSFSKTPTMESKSGSTWQEYGYTKDIRGSITHLVNDTNSIITDYDYSDYGQTTISGNTSTGNELAYTGGVYDQVTGQYYLNARYYNPATGNFITMDSYKGDEGADKNVNLYGYCGGNPVNYVDPSGHAAEYYKNFNCYSYAIGEDKKWRHPGHGYKIGDITTKKGIYKLKEMPKYYSIYDLCGYVIKDLKKFKIKYRVISSKYQFIYPGEYRIAMRVKTSPGITKDFHFWKQDPVSKLWWEKKGKKKIRSLRNANPDDYKFWEYETKGKKQYYNSKTLYLAINNKFWTDKKISKSHPH